MSIILGIVQIYKYIIFENEKKSINNKLNIINTDQYKYKMNKMDKKCVVHTFIRQIIMVIK